MNPFPGSGSTHVHPSAGGTAAEPIGVHLHRGPVENAAIAGTIGSPPEPGAAADHAQVRRSGRGSREQGAIPRRLFLLLRQAQSRLALQRREAPGDLGKLVEISLRLPDAQLRIRLEPPDSGFQPGQESLVIVGAGTVHFDAGSVRSRLLRRRRRRRSNSVLAAWSRSETSDRISTRATGREGEAVPADIPETTWWQVMAKYSHSPAGARKRR